MASLVDQILQQSQIGSAGGQGFGEYFLQGKKLQQNQQQINLQEQELAQKAALIPLEKELMRQDAAMKAINIENILQRRQDEIYDARFVQQAAGDIGAMLEVGETKGALAQWMHAAATNYRLLKDPGFLELRKAIDVQAEIAEFMLRAEAYSTRVNTAAGNLELNRQKEERLEDKFEFEKKKWESQIPKDRLELFRSRAAVIKNDLNLIGDSAKQVEMLNELAKEFGVGMPASASPPPSPTPTPGKKIGRFEVIPR